MTGLQSREGAELDKRGRRLRGQARSHTGSPGGWGEQGDNPQGLWGRDSFGRGPDRVRLPTPTDPWYSCLYVIPRLGVGRIRLTSTEPPSPASPSKEPRPVAATQGSLEGDPPNHQVLPPRLRLLTPREYEAIVFAALSRQIWDDLLHSSSALTHREATEPRRAEVLLHLQGSPEQGKNLQEGSGGESATQGTDLLLQKSPTSPAPPWRDGRLPTLAIQTHRCPPSFPSSQARGHLSP